MQKVRRILGIVVALLAPASLAWAQSTVPIFPSATSPQAIGAEFDVEVKVGNSTNPVSNLFGLSFELNYTNTNFVDVVGSPTQGDFLGSDIIFLPIVDDPNGKVSVGMSRKAGQGGANGNGTVMKVKFKTLANTPNGTQIQFTITSVSANDPNSGSITLTPSPLTIVIVVCPIVSGINPTSGGTGTAVTITGTGLTGVTAVKFANNVTATFTVNSATQITTTVPNGAVTGPITISKTGCTDIQTPIFTIKPLPVELADFRANVVGADVELIWRTISESNNYGFEVQRRLTDDEFQKIGFVAGNGTSLKSHLYRFVDKGLASGVYTYRLKQIDLDGSFTYSATIEAIMSVASETFELHQNRPNPFNPVTTIEFVLGRTQPARLAVYSVLGREVAILFDGQAEAGNFYRLEFDGAQQASGIYFARLQSGERTQTCKMLLSK